VFRAVQGDVPRIASWSPGRILAEATSARTWDRTQPVNAAQWKAHDASVVAAERRCHRASSSREAAGAGPSTRASARPLERGRWGGGSVLRRVQKGGISEVPVATAAAWLATSRFLFALELPDQLLRPVLQCLEQLPFVVMREFSERSNAQGPPAVRRQLPLPRGRLWDGPGDKDPWSGSRQPSVTGSVTGKLRRERCPARQLADHPGAHPSHRVRPRSRACASREWNPRPKILGRRWPMATRLRADARATERAGAEPDLVARCPPPPLGGRGGPGSGRRSRAPALGTR
jgi:hypothetical protein